MQRRTGSTTGGLLVGWRAALLCAIAILRAAAQFVVCSVALRGHRYGAKDAVSVAKKAARKQRTLGKQSNERRMGSTTGEFTG